MNLMTAEPLHGLYELLLNLGLPGPFGLQNCALIFWGKKKKDSTDLSVIQQ